MQVLVGQLKIRISEAPEARLIFLEFEYFLPWGELGAKFRVDIGRSWN